MTNYFIKFTSKYVIQFDESLIRSGVKKLPSSFCRITHSCQSSHSNSLTERSHIGHLYKYFPSNKDYFHNTQNFSIISKKPTLNLYEHMSPKIEQTAGKSITRIHFIGVHDTRLTYMTCAATSRWKESNSMGYLCGVIHHYARKTSDHPWKLRNTAKIVHTSAQISISLLHLNIRILKYCTCLSSVKSYIHHHSWPVSNGQK